MRTIKFRAWNTDYHPNPLMEYFEWNDLKKIERLQDKQIMQFTGLHDKNGREIYENDIVKWGHTEGYGSEIWHRVSVVEMEPALQFRILHYIDSQTMERKEGDNYVFTYGRFMYAQTEKYLEVIGNIHENPELL